VKAALGIDIGTSAVKVLLLGLDGDVLAERAADYPTARRHSGWAEQAPADWWRATVAAIADVRAAAPEPDVVAVGLTGQLNGFVLLDEADAPLGDGFLLPRLGDRFTLLTIDAEAPDLIEEDGIEVTRLALSVKDDPTLALKERYLGDAPSAVYLIRPDQHVAARRASFDETLFRAAIRRATGKE